MEYRAITIYVLCDDLLKTMRFYDDSQCKMSTAEIMTFSILAAKDFVGNHKLARSYFKRLGYFSNMLSNSQLNRRVRQIPWLVWITIFRFFAYLFTQRNTSKTFAVDSFPILSCQKSRIDKRRLFKETEFIGFSASKKKYFCGIKVHMIVTLQGEPVECLIRPASENDISVLWKMEIDLPPSSLLYAYGAYTCFELEDLLNEDEKITLLSKRGCKIKKRLRSDQEEKEISSRRQIVETAFSSITRLLPRTFQLRTEQGFLLRVYSAILAYCISFFC